MQQILDGLDIFLDQAEVRVVLSGKNFCFQDFQLVSKLFRRFG
jgi:hypothetical protein